MPISGKMGDMAPGTAPATDPYATVIAQHKAQAMQGYDNARAEAHAAAARGDEAAVEGYLKLADGYRAEYNKADELSMASIKAGQERTRAPNEQEAALLTASGRDPKNWQVANGKFEKIPDEDENKTQVIQLADGTHQVVDAKTGELIGKPIGLPKEKTMKNFRSSEKTNSAIKNTAPWISMAMLRLIPLPLILTHWEPKI